MLYLLSKGGKAKATLVPVKRAVNRGGKIHYQIFYVKPAEAEKEKRKKSVDFEPPPKSKYVDDKGNVNNHPEGGFFLSSLDDNNSYVAIKVPPENISHTFQASGRTWVVHRRLSKNVDKAWMLDWSITDAETGRVLNIADGFGTPKEAEKWALDQLIYLKDKHGEERFNAEFTRHEAVKNLKVDKQQFQTLQPLSEEWAKEQINEALASVGRHDGLPSDIYRMMMNKIESSEELLDRLSALSDLAIDPVDWVALKYIAREQPKADIWAASKNIEAGKMYVEYFEQSHQQVSLIELIEWANVYDNGDLSNLSLYRYVIDPDEGGLDEGVPTNRIFMDAVRNSRTISESFSAIEADLIASRIARAGKVGGYINETFEERTNRLEKGSTSVATPLNKSGGINAAYKVTLHTEKGDIDAIFKPVDGEANAYRAVQVGTYYIREMLGYELARVIGSELIPPTVIRQDENGAWGSAQEWHYGYETYCMSEKQMAISFAESQEASILDYLMYNTDRHGNNYMINQTTGGLKLPDHGLCFPDAERDERFVDTAFYTSGHIDDTLKEKLHKAPWGKFLSLMADHGLDSAVEGFEKRLQWMLNTDKIPDKKEVQIKVWNSEVYDYLPYEDWK